MDRFSLFCVCEKKVQREVFRKNHLIRLAESIKPKRSLKNDRFLLSCLSNQIYCSKNILLNCKKKEKKTIWVSL